MCASRYGEDRVAQIITFGSFLARGVMRNVGRVLEMPLGQVDKLAKLVPQNPAKPVTLKQAVADEPHLQEAAGADPKVGEDAGDRRAAGGALFQRLDPRRRRRHRRPAAGRAGAALSRPEVGDAGDPVQHEMGRAGGPGQVRLSRPEDADDAAQGAEPARAARRRRSTSAQIPLDDAKTYEMLGRGETVGVFQVESAGMRKALVEMRADRFEDIIALVALYRPGPMANIPTYCARKLGHETPDYIHPKVEPVLKETFGVIIYQEQVMQIAQILSGYSLGEADMLRRAMGKKIKAEMDAQRARFVDGAVERGVAQGQGRRDLRPARQIRRLRLQQEPRGGLRADRLLDRLVQGQPPGRIPRRVDDARQGQHRQARRIPRRGAAARHQGRAALGQRLRTSISTCARRRRRADDRLCA